MKKKKILVMTDHMPWGHRSIAKAIYAFLKSKEKSENFEVYYAEARAKTGIYGDIYLFSYRYLPASNKVAGWVSNRSIAGRFVDEMAEANLKEPQKVINKLKPDLVISTYWLHTHSLAIWRERDNLDFKLWTVVADPWSIMPVSYHRGVDLHLVYDEKGVEIGVKKCGIDRDKILVTGWWTRPEMFKKHNQKQLKKKMGIEEKVPVVFVGGGSLGTNAITRLLPALMMVKRKTVFIFNTGTDKVAFNLVNEYLKMFKKIDKKGLVKVKNMGWIDNMDEVLAVSDIVFGKAGPNFLFDVVAANKPFVSITHIGGQEDGNVDLIRKKGLGWVREKRTQAGDFLLNYLDNPKEYQRKFKKTIMAEVARNKRSMEIILKRIKKEMAEKK